MARTVFILGAGASVEAGVPDLARFIDSADDLRTHDRGHIAAEEFDLFFEVLQTRLPQLHQKSIVDLSNIESVFSLIEMGRLLNRLPGTDPDEIPKITHAVRTVLAQTVERTCRFSWDDGSLQPPSPYAPFVSQAVPSWTHGAPGDVAFITLNYDIALDFALHQASVPFDYCLVRNSTTAITGSVPLLKLHGSLNWTSCQKDNTVIDLPLVDLTRLWRPPHPRKDQRSFLPLAVTPHLESISHCLDAKRTTMPALVPPSWNKTQYHEQFSTVWERAATELADAQRVVVIGYSLPASDSFFHDLVALALAGPTRVREFIIVNPDEQVEERFGALLGPEVRPRLKLFKGSFLGWIQQSGAALVTSDAKGKGSELRTILGQGRR